MTKTPMLEEWNLHIDPDSGRLGPMTKVLLWLANRSYQLCTDPWSYVVISLDRQGAELLVALIEHSDGGSSSSAESDLRQRVIRVLGDRLTQSKNFYTTRSGQDVERDENFPEYVVSFLFSRRAAVALASVLHLFTRATHIDLFDARKRLVFFLDRRSALMLRDLLAAHDPRMRDEDFRDELIDTTHEWLQLQRE